MARVLVVDDEPHLLRLVQIHLERAGHSVLTLQDPTQALDTIRRERPDLILLDMLMPVVDGFEIQQALANDESLRTLRVVLLSVKSAHSDIFQKVRSELASAGCPYLTKPFHPRELVALIDRLLDPPRS